MMLRNIAHSSLLRGLYALSLLVSTPIVLACDSRASAAESGKLKMPTLALDARFEFDAPPRKGENTVIVWLSDEYGEPVSGAMLSVVPWMPAHGHGSPVNVHVADNRDGSYRASPVVLHMAGFWEISISAEAEKTSATTVLVADLSDPTLTSTGGNSTAGSGTDGAGETGTDDISPECTSWKDCSVSPGDPPKTCKHGRCVCTCPKDRTQPAGTCCGGWACGGSGALACSTTTCCY